MERKVNSLSKESKPYLKVVPLLEKSPIEEQFKEPGFIEKTREILRRNLLENISSTYYPEEKINDSDIFNYLLNYLIYRDETGFQTGMMVIENEYVSLAYSVDYSAYYSKSFRAYDKYCKRIHFFHKEYKDEIEFKKILYSNEEHEEFWSKYIGYIVIKPLPNSLIGSSLIANYRLLESDKIESQPNTRKRHFNTVRKYKVNLVNNF